MSTPTITIIRGDTQSIALTIVNSTGLPVDITGGEVFFTVNSNSSPTDDAGAAIELSSGGQPSQVVLTNPAQGKATITISSANSNIAPGAYYYDIQFKDSLGNVTSMPQGSFLVNADITRRTV